MGKPLRVLLVEDSEDDAQLTIRTLTKGGYDPIFERVETAETMRRALKDRSWDIIICDYSLPQFSGQEAITVWQEDEPHLPLIILSGVIGEEMAVAAMRAGARDYIMKGNLSRLIPTIERELKETIERREKRLAEKELLKSEERFRLISQTLFGFVYSCSKQPDRPYAIDWITGATKSVTGYDPEEIINWGCWEKMVIEEDIPLFSDKVIGLSPGQMSICDLRIRHKDGSLRWLKAYSKVFREDLKHLRLYGACQDITEQKRLEQELRHSTEEVTLLNRFTQEVSSSLSWQHITDFALSEMIRVLKADLAFLFTREGERLTLMNVKPDTRRDWLGPLPEHRVGECLCGLAVRQGEPLYIRNIDIDARCTLEECRKAGFRSLAVLPLKKGREILGVIGLASQGERDFKRQGEFLETLVAPVTVSLQNARLYEETKSSREALLRSELNYRRLYDSMRDAFVSVDITGHIREFNQAYAELLGYSEEELRVMTYVDLTPERWHAFEADLVQNQILTRGYSDIYEKEYRRKDGSVFPVELRTFLIRENGGEPIGMWAIVRDISERKKVENERLRLILAIEQSAETVVITDREGTIQYVNPAFTTVTGYRRDEALGHNPRILKSGVQDEAFYRQLWQTISKGRTWQGRLVNCKKNGTLYTEEATISPVFDDAGGIINYVAVKRDITEHLHLFAEKEKIQNQFLQAQKMESIGRLAGGVAHDFNNMLSVIIGQTELAMLQSREATPLYAALQEIHKAAQRSADLTRQLLAFARKQIVMPQVLDLNDLVASLLKMLRRLIGEDIHLLWVPGPDLWPVKVDPSQMDQILANLSVNARDAINGVGKITIETKNITVDETDSSKEDGFCPGQYVKLMVSDNGCGMDKETQFRLFEPFFTTKDLGKGTGLGLATVYGIVKQNNGFIYVTSEPGKGSAFSVYLPRYTGEPLKAKTEEPPEPMKGRGETVLIVDDEETILEMAKHMLERLGYQVLIASTPNQALRLAEEHPGKIHCLFSDLVMPEMTGRLLAERLGVICPGIKYLFMSGYTSDVFAQQGLIPEEVRFIQKPFSLYDLALKVREVLDRK
jgi:two-component system, cell cycle sensor histidine kinase and response regulator CckA